MADKTSTDYPPLTAMYRWIEHNSDSDGAGFSPPVRIRQKHPNRKR